MTSKRALAMVALVWPMAAWGQDETAAPPKPAATAASPESSAPADEPERPSEPVDFEAALSQPPAVEPAAAASPVTSTPPASPESPVTDQAASATTTPAKPLPLHYYSRDNRFLDGDVDLASNLARDGGLALRPMWGGLAPDLMPRGAAAPFGGDLEVYVDGMPYGIPFAGRGVDYRDLRLLPVGAIGGYSIRTGMRPGGFGGRVDMDTRSLDGVDASFMIGDRERRQLSAAAGMVRDHAQALLAIDWRGKRGLTKLAGDELLTMLGTATFDLGEDLEVGVSLRYYRELWDEVGTMLTVPGACDAADATACEATRVFSAGPTDGGDLRGTGASTRMTWQPTDDFMVEVGLGYLEDRFNRYFQDGSGQREDRQYNRVTTARAEVELTTDWPVVTAIGALGEFGYDNAAWREFATTARTRLYRASDWRGDWIKGGVSAWVALEPVEHLQIRVTGGVEHLTLRRTLGAAGPEVAANASVMPVYCLDAAYAFDDEWRVSLRWARENTTGPTRQIAAIGTPPPAGREGEAVELGLFGGLIEGDWILRGSVAAYAGLYGRAALGDVVDVSQHAYAAVGGDLTFDLTHTPTALALVARGGPTFTDPDGPSDFGVQTPGVPSYTMYIGVLRRVEEGVLAEAWIGAWGDYAVAWPDASGQAGQLAPPQQEVSVRVGYRFGAASLWVGIDNLLDSPPNAPPDLVVRRGMRTIYGMVSVADL
jgi:hypothetical protein